MATLITVHGTFAHMEIPPGEDPSRALQPQWWEADSSFSDDMRAALDGDGKPFEVSPFVWSGDNSEAGRRNEASRLLNKFEELEARGERYAVIGHSHGGSVVAWSLMEAASKRNPLPGLQRWMTVGTPFVELRRESLLFLRLPLLFKALFVASFMLLFMYLFTLAGDLASGAINFDNERRLWRLGMSTVLVALPFVAYYGAAWWYDRQQLYHYRRSTRRRAHNLFADRWLSLTHEDDEAVQGLGSLNQANFKVFSRDFAVPVISVLSVFLLPVAYLILLTSPNTMVKIADFLKTEVYDLGTFSTQEQAFEQQLRKLRRIRRQIRRMRARDAGLATPGTSQSPGEAKSAQSEEMRRLRRERRFLRQQMQQDFPEFRSVARALRFKRRFFKRNGQLCADGQLCGKGYDLSVNSKLLFHLVTDEASSLVLDPDQRPTGSIGRFFTSLIPILLVPIVFAIIAVVLVFAIQWLASLFSRFMSGALDQMTWAEINRAALGNDTGTEVAIRAAPRPVWMESKPVFLPPELGDLVAAKSNEAAVSTIARLRNTLSDLTFVDGAGDQNRSLLAILSWQELIHMVYFEVPAFREVIAAALAEGEGFQAKTPVTPKAQALLVAITPHPTRAVA